MRFRYVNLLLFSLVTLCLVCAGIVDAATYRIQNAPKPTYDRDAARPTEIETVGPALDYSRKYGYMPPSLAPPLISAVERFMFEDFSLLSSGVPGPGFIPPDPHCAVGPEHVINVGNVIIEWRLKDKEAVPGGEHKELLKDFFFAGGTGIPPPPIAPFTSLGTSTFDPKVIYDQYAGRFIVITLEKWDIGSGDPSDESRILVAVSKTGDPSLGWWFHAIDSHTLIGGVPTWADYPGLAIDDKAIYITNNMFGFSAAPGYFGVRLWILDKAWYAGPNQSAGVTIHDPYAAAGIPTTTQPAHMYGPPPLGSTGLPLGTFLCSYSGLTIDPAPPNTEAVQVVEVTDPLGGGGGPFFAHQFVECDNIEGDAYPALPDAPQAGSTTGGHSTRCGGMAASTRVRRYSPMPGRIFSKPLRIGGGSTRRR